MRYRALSSSGDYTLGIPFLVNSPACVAQAVLTRLKLWQGEWFVDVLDGTPYTQQILGVRRLGQNPDSPIQQRILGTPNVLAISSYSSQYDGTKRTFTVNATVVTAYGKASLTATL